MHDDGLVRLAGERLVLRDIRQSDWRGIHEFAADPDVYRYLHWRPTRRGHVKDWVREVVARQSERPRKEYRLVIELPDSERPIGSCGLDLEGGRTAALVFLLHSGFRGRGYATEAVAVLLDFAFGTLRLHRVYAVCDTRNGASAAVMERLGMRREGLHVEHSLLGGEWCDVFSYAILSREWKERKDENR